MERRESCVAIRSPRVSYTDEALVQLTQRGSRLDRQQKFLQRREVDGSIYRGEAITHGALSAASPNHCQHTVSISLALCGSLQLQHSVTTCSNINASSCRQCSGQTSHSTAYPYKSCCWHSSQFLRIEHYILNRTFCCLW